MSDHLILLTVCVACYHATCGKCCPQVVNRFVFLVLVRAYATKKGNERTFTCAYVRGHWPYLTSKHLRQTIISSGLKGVESKICSSLSMMMLICLFLFDHMLISTTSGNGFLTKDWSLPLFVRKVFLCLFRVSLAEAKKDTAVTCDASNSFPFAMSVRT